MNRIVLAILALFAGLAAQVTPAEARICGTTEIGTTLGLKSSAKVSAITVAPAFRPEPQDDARVAERDIYQLPLASPAVFTVYLGADRARE